MQLFKYGMGFNYFPLMKNQNSRHTPPPIIRLKATRSYSHPWIFSKMVTFPYKRLENGSIVEIRSKDNEFIGYGTWHADQMVALRVISEDVDQPINEAFIRRRLERAHKLRNGLLNLTTQSDSYRLVHAEADGLSGIIIDKLGDVLVIEPFSAGILSMADWLVAGLKNLYPNCKVGIRNAPKVETRENISLSDLINRYPLPDRTVVTENGLKFEVDFKTGHKTGFFLDQRDNRQLVSRMAAGATVFDLCCYTGGFALSALKGGARKVFAVDLDEEALVTAHANAKLNNFPAGGQELEFIHANTFDFLRKAIDDKKTADLVILDPAKLAGVKDEISRAMRTYGDFNKLALQAVKHGGTLVTCSCSGLIPDDTFKSIVCRSALETGKELQFFQMAGAGPDHPVSSIFPEGRYLKVIFARVFNRGA